MYILMKKIAPVFLLASGFQIMTMDINDPVLQKVIKVNKTDIKIEDFSDYQMSDVDIQDVMNISDEAYDKVFQICFKQKELDGIINSKLKEILCLDTNTEISTASILMMKKNNLNDVLSLDECQKKIGGMSEGQTNFSVALLLQNKDNEYSEALTYKLLACGGDINQLLRSNNGHRNIDFYPITACMDYKKFNYLMKKFIILGAQFDVPMQHFADTLTHLKTPLVFAKQYRCSDQIIQLLQCLEQYKNKLKTSEKVDFLKKIDKADQDMYLTIVLNDDKTHVGVDYYLDNNLTTINHILYLMAINKNISLQYLPYLLCKGGICGSDLAKIEKNNFKYNDFKNVAKAYSQWIVLLKGKLKLVDNNGDILRNIFSYLNQQDLQFLRMAPVFKK